MAASPDILLRRSQDKSAASDQTLWRRALARLAWFWKRVRLYYNVLELVRFSLLLGLVGGLVLLFNDQAQDVLRKLGEDSKPGPLVAFFVAAVMCAAVAWWSARVIFYFRFGANPASHPKCCPAVKEYLSRALGASALVLPAVALLKAAAEYGAGFDAAMKMLWWLGGGLAASIVLAVGSRTAAKRFPAVRAHQPRLVGASALALFGAAVAFTVVALFKATVAHAHATDGAVGSLLWLARGLFALAIAFLIATTRRHAWGRYWGWLGDEGRPQGLRRLFRDGQAPRAWAPLLIAAAAGFALMVWLAYRVVEDAPYLGTAAIALAAMAGVIFVGAFLVYASNRAKLPVLALVLLLAVGVSYAVDISFSLPAALAVIVTGVAAGAIVSGMAGFAFSPVAAGLVLHVLPPAAALPLLLSCSLLNQIIGIVALRHSIRWRQSLLFIAAGLLGAPLGVQAVLLINPRIFGIGFGLLLIAYSLYMLARPFAGVVRYDSPAALVAVGFLGGLVGGLTAFPGAALVVWSGLRGLTKAAQRALVQPFILAMQVVSLACFARTEGWEAIVRAELAFVLPAVALGTSLGLVLYGKVDEHQFRRLVLSLLILSGLVLLVR